MPNFDYSDYGAFKNSVTSGTTLISVARKLGLRNRYLRFLKDADKNLPVIELGCGNGAFLRDLLNAGFTNVRGVEPSATYQSLVDPKLIIQDRASPFLNSLPRHSLGAVIALDVLEHISRDELKNLLTLIADRLAQNGLLVFRVPNMASALALTNYFGDLSHVTPLNASSIRQLAYGTGLRIASINPEPFSRPTSVFSLIGILLWPLTYLLQRSMNAAFGIRNSILTPNLICILRRG
jgi:SAM-dependent methyltransferase